MPNPEKSKINYLAIGVTVLVSFIVFGLGGYYLGVNNKQYRQNSNIIPSPTPVISPTTWPAKESGWSIYNNTQKDFTISYPSEWQVDNSEEILGKANWKVTFTPSSELSVKGVNFRTKVTIESENENKIQFREFIIQELFNEWLAKNASSGDGERLYKLANVTIDGYDAVKFVVRTLPGDGTEPYYSIIAWLRISYDDYYFELAGDEEKVLQNVTTFDKMLQSFKFSR